VLARLDVKHGRLVSARLKLADEVIALAVDIAADAVVRIIDPHPVAALMSALASKGEGG
jgi:hypothetical protein